MFDPLADIIRMRPMADDLAKLLSRLPPGTPEYQAAYSACEAFQRVHRVIALSPRWGAATRDNRVVAGGGIEPPTCGL